MSDGSAAVLLSTPSRCSQVERLVHDVCTTTDQYRVIRRKIEAMEQENSQAKAHSQPLAKENARIVHENNEVASRCF